MQGYVIRRLGTSMLSLFFVSLIIFMSLRASPGDVVDALLADAGYTPERAAVLREQLGLDRPVIVQYGDWAGDLLTGDMGISLFTGKPVRASILERLPITFELAAGAVSVAVVLGILVGVTAAVWRDRPLDYITRTIAIGMVSLPSFVLALSIIAFPARFWGWTIPLKYFPPSDFTAHVTFMAAPVLLLGALLSGSVQRMTRAIMIEVLSSDYIRTARAKGLAESRVIFGHALKNAAIPVVTIIGGQLAFLFGGSVIMESIFSIPGMGRLTVEGLNVRDFPVVQGAAMTFATAVIVMNLLVDLSYVYLDPRVRY